jgi:hypothetical protein
MNPQQPPKKTLLYAAVALLGVIVVCFVAFVGYDALTFRIVSQDPAPKTSVPAEGSLIFTTNHDLADRDKQVITLSPQVFGAINVDGKTASFQPVNELTVGTTYTATVTLLSKAGKQVKTSFTFTADTGDFSAAQSAQSVKQTDTIEQQYDVLEKNLVPYRDSDYYLKYSLPSGESDKLQIEIYPTPPEYVYESAADLAQFKTDVTEKAKKRLTDNGVDLTKYLITTVD